MFKYLFKKNKKIKEKHYCKRCKGNLYKIRALSIMGDNLCDDCRIDDSD